jgi:hypothetical protein
MNIPFQHAECIELQKITLYNKKKYIHNFFPVLVRFQIRVRTYVRWVKKQRAVKAILKRELTG